jgi:signal transduction histidine kinase
MDTQTLLEIMAVFTGTAAVALVIQAVMLISLYRSSRAAQGSLEKLAGKIDAMANNSVSAVAEIKNNVAQITAKSNAILDSTSRQLARIEEVVNDATGRAKNQLDRAEMVLDDAMTRAQETIAVVHGGIMRPLREISGVTQGVRAAFQYFLRGGRPNPDQATADEEMFI